MSKFLESVNNALNENNRAVIEATMHLNEEFLDNQFEKKHDDSDYNKQNYTRFTVEDSAKAQIMVEKLREEGYDAATISFNGQYIVESSNWRIDEMKTIDPIPQYKPEEAYNTNKESEEQEYAQAQTEQAPEYMQPEYAQPEYQQPAPTANAYDPYADRAEYNMTEETHSDPVFTGEEGTQAYGYASSNFASALCDVLNEINTSAEFRDERLRDFNNSVGVANTEKEQSYNALNAEAAALYKTVDPDATNTEETFKEWLGKKEEAAIVDNVQDKYHNSFIPDVAPAVPRSFAAAGDSVFLNPLNLINAGQAVDAPKNHDNQYAMYLLEQANLPVEKVAYAYEEIRTNPEKYVDMFRIENGATNLEAVMAAVAAEPAAKIEKFNNGTLREDVHTAIQAMIDGKDVTTELGLEQNTLQGQITTAIVVAAVKDLGFDTTAPITKESVLAVQDEIVNKYGAPVSFELPKTIEEIPVKPPILEIPQLFVQEKYTEAPIGEPVYSDTPTGVPDIYTPNEFYPTVENQYPDVAKLFDPATTYSEAGVRDSGYTEFMQAQAYAETQQVAYLISAIRENPEMLVEIAHASEMPDGTIPALNLASYVATMDTTVPPKEDFKEMVHTAVDTVARTGNFDDVFDALEFSKTSVQDQINYTLVINEVRKLGLSPETSIDNTVKTLVETKFKEHFHEEISLRIDEVTPVVTNKPELMDLKLFVPQEHISHYLPAETLTELKDNRFFQEYDTKFTNTVEEYARADYYASHSVSEMNDVYCQLTCDSTKYGYEESALRKVPEKYSDDRLENDVRVAIETIYQNDGNMNSVAEALNINSFSEAGQARLNIIFEEAAAIGFVTGREIDHEEVSSRFAVRFNNSLMVEAPKQNIVLTPPDLSKVDKKAAEIFENAGLFKKHEEIKYQHTEKIFKFVPEYAKDTFREIQYMNQQSHKTQTTTSEFSETQAEEEYEEDRHKNERKSFEENSGFFPLSSKNDDIALVPGSENSKGTVAETLKKIQNDTDIGIYKYNEQYTHAYAGGINSIRTMTNAQVIKSLGKGAFDDISDRLISELDLDPETAKAVNTAKRVHKGVLKIITEYSLYTEETGNIHEGKKTSKAFEIDLGNGESAVIIDGEIIKSKSRLEQFDKQKKQQIKQYKKVEAGYEVHIADVGRINTVKKSAYNAKQFASRIPEGASKIIHKGKPISTVSLKKSEPKEFVPLKPSAKIVERHDYVQKRKEELERDISIVNVSGMTRLNSSRTSEITKVAAKLRTDALLVGLSKTFTAHDADIDLFKKTTNLINNGTANGMMLVASSEEKKVLAKLQKAGKVDLTYAERRTLTVVLTRHQKTIETARRADLAALNSEIETIRSNTHITTSEKTANLKNLEAKRNSIESDFKASVTELSIAKKKFGLSEAEMEHVKEAQKELRGISSLMDKTVAKKFRFSSEEIKLASNIIGTKGLDLSTEEKTLLVSLRKGNVEITGPEIANLQNIMTRYETVKRNEINVMISSAAGLKGKEREVADAKIVKAMESLNAEKALMAETTNRISTTGTIGVTHDLSAGFASNKYDEIFLIKLNANFIEKADELGINIFGIDGKISVEKLKAIPVGSKVAMELGLTEEGKELLIKLNTRKNDLAYKISNGVNFFVQKFAKLSKDEGLNEFLGYVNTAQQAAGLTVTAGKTIHTQISTARVQAEAFLKKHNLINEKPPKAKKSMYDRLSKQRKPAGKLKKTYHKIQNWNSVGTAKMTAFFDKMPLHRSARFINGKIEAFKARVANSALGKAISKISSTISAAVSHVIIYAGAAAVVVSAIVAIIGVVATSVSGMVDAIRGLDPMTSKLLQANALKNSLAYNGCALMQEQEDIWLKNTLGDFTDLNKYKDKINYSLEFLPYTYYMQTIPMVEIVSTKGDLASRQAYEGATDLYINPFIVYYYKTDGGLKYEVSKGEDGNPILVERGSSTTAGTVRHIKLVEGSKYEADGHIVGNTINPIWIWNPDAKAKDEYQLGHLIKDFGEGQKSIEIVSNSNKFNVVNNKSGESRITYSSIQEKPSNKKKKDAVDEAFSDDDLKTSLYYTAAAEDGTTSNNKDIIAMTDITFSHAMQDADDASAAGLMGMDVSLGGAGLLVGSAADDAKTNLLMWAANGLDEAKEEAAGSGEADKFMSTDNGGKSSEDLVTADLIGELAGEALSEYMVTDDGKMTPTYAMVTNYMLTLHKMSHQVAYDIGVDKGKGDITTTKLPVTGVFGESCFPYVAIFGAENSTTGTKIYDLSMPCVTKEDKIDTSGEVHLNVPTMSPENRTNITLNIDDNYYQKDGQYIWFLDADAPGIEEMTKSLCMPTGTSKDDAFIHNHEEDGAVIPAFGETPEWDNAGNYGTLEASDCNFYYHVWNHGGSEGPHYSFGYDGNHNLVDTSDGCWTMIDQKINDPATEEELDDLHYSYGHAENHDWSVFYEEKAHERLKEIKTILKEKYEYTNEVDEEGIPYIKLVRTYYDADSIQIADSPYKHDYSGCNIAPCGKQIYDDDGNPIRRDPEDKESGAYFEVKLRKCVETYVHYCKGHDFNYHAGELRTISTGIVYSMTNEQKALTDIMEPKDTPIARYDDLSTVPITLSENYRFSMKQTLNTLHFKDFYGKINERALNLKGTFDEANESGKSDSPTSNPQGSYFGSLYGLPLLGKNNQWLAGASKAEVKALKDSGYLPSQAKNLHGSIMPHAFTGAAGTAALAQAFYDIFDVDTYLDKGSNALALHPKDPDENDGWRYYHGWTAEEMQLAVNKRVMDWNGIYGFDFPENYKGVVPFSEEDYYAIVKNASFDDDTSKKVYEAVLPWIGKAHFTMNSEHTQHDFLSCVCGNGEKVEHMNDLADYHASDSGTPFYHQVSCLAATGGSFSNYVIKSIGGSERVEECGGWTKMSSLDTSMLEPGDIIRWKLGSVDSDAYGSTNRYDFMVYLGTLNADIAIDPINPKTGQKAGSISGGTPLFAKMVLAKDIDYKIGAIDPSKFEGDELPIYSQTYKGSTPFKYTYTNGDSKTTYTPKGCDNGNFGSLRLVSGQEVLAAVMEESRKSETKVEVKTDFLGHPKNTTVYCGPGEWEYLKVR